SIGRWYRLWRPFTLYLGTMAILQKLRSRNRDAADHQPGRHRRRRERADDPVLRTAGSLPVTATDAIGLSTVRRGCGRALAFHQARAGPGLLLEGDPGAAGFTHPPRRRVRYGRAQNQSEDWTRPTEDRRP